MPAAGTGLFPGTGLLMLWDRNVTGTRIWMEIPVPRLPLVQVEDFVSCTAYQHRSQPCGWESHHHSLICREFSFCTLTGRAYWCTKGIDRIYLLISPSFLLLLQVCPKYRTCLCFSSKFKAVHPFLMGVWTRGRAGHLLVSWVDEYLSHALRAKPETCYGKVN